jgi:hypothetical protein
MKRKKMKNENAPLKIKENDYPLAISAGWIAARIQGDSYPVPELSLMTEGALYRDMGAALESEPLSAETRRILEEYNEVRELKDGRILELFVDIIHYFKNDFKQK